MSISQTPTGDEIARCVLRTFEELPAKFKPTRRSPESREWVPLSGIVLSKSGHPLTCVALGTGMKCLPCSKLPNANGNILHDCHAEVLAIRAFNRFLIHECEDLVQTGASISSCLRRRRTSDIPDNSDPVRPFVVKEGIFFHMYCSEAPCGDASMELVMRAQEDPTPWDNPPASDRTIDDRTVAMMGRGYFSQLGIVRRKPSRSDAPLTLSKSCTDKLTIRQCTSLLSTITSTLVSSEGAYLQTLVLPESQHVTEAITRAFSAEGRLKALTADVMSKWPDGYSFRPFRIATALDEFHYSRRAGSPGQNLIPSNKSAIYTPYFQEILIGGVLQGRKQTDPQSASAVSRRKIWQAVLSVVRHITVLEDNDDSGPFGIRINCVLDRGRWISQCDKYRHLKQGSIPYGRNVVKSDITAALGGWDRNDGDDDFGLETSTSP